MRDLARPHSPAGRSSVSMIRPETVRNPSSTEPKVRGRVVRREWSGRRGGTASRSGGLGLKDLVPGWSRTWPHHRPARGRRGRAVHARDRRPQPRARARRRPRLPRIATVSRARRTVVGARRGRSRRNRRRPRASLCISRHNHAPNSPFAGDADLASCAFRSPGHKTRCRSTSCRSREHDPKQTNRRNRRQAPSSPKLPP